MRCGLLACATVLAAAGLGAGWTIAAQARGSADPIAGTWSYGGATIEITQVTQGSGGAQFEARAASTVTLGSCTFSPGRLIFYVVFGLDGSQYRSVVPDGSCLGPNYVNRFELETFADSPSFWFCRSAGSCYRLVASETTTDPATPGVVEVGTGVYCCFGPINAAYEAERKTLHVAWSPPPAEGMVPRFLWISSAPPGPSGALGSHTRIDTATCGVRPGMTEASCTLGLTSTVWVQVSFRCDAGPDCYDSLGAGEAVLSGAIEVPVAAPTPQPKPQPQPQPKPQPSVEAYRAKLTYAVTVRELERGGKTYTVRATVRFGMVVRAGRLVAQGYPITAAVGDGGSITGRFVFKGYACTWEDGSQITNASFRCKDRASQGKLNRVRGTLTAVRAR
jgi:hypothetical protein